MVYILTLELLTQPPTKACIIYPYPLCWIVDKSLYKLTHCVEVLTRPPTRACITLPIVLSCWPDPLQELVLLNLTHCVELLTRPYKAVDQFTLLMNYTVFADDTSFDVTTEIQFIIIILECFWQWKCTHNIIITWINMQFFPKFSPQHSHFSSPPPPPPETDPWLTSLIHSLSLSMAIP